MGIHWRWFAAVAVVAVSLPAGAPRAAAPEIAELLNRYERGEFATVERALSELPQPPRPWPVYGADASDRLFRDYTALAPRWISAAGPDATPRRRLIAAAFALELALARRGPWPVRYPFLVWGCELLRSAPATLPGERWWHLASVALLESRNDWVHVLGEERVSLQPGMYAPPNRRRFFSRADQLEFTQGHVAHARAAFPGEPRLRLADAHYAESLTFLPTSGPTGINTQQTSPELLESLDRMTSQRFNASLDARSVKMILDRVNLIPRAVDRYAALAVDGALRADAELHQGFLALRLEAWDQALAHLNAVPESADPMLVALAELFRGWVFEQTGRTSEAIEAYRRSLAAAPLARTTSILLAAQLARTGRQQEAYAIADAALRAAPTLSLETVPSLDPWPLYKRGDAVMLRTYLDRLREAVR